jgi:hypothetical protein
MRSHLQSAIIATRAAKIIPDNDHPNRLTPKQHRAALKKLQKHYLKSGGWERQEQVGQIINNALGSDYNLCDRRQTSGLPTGESPIPWDRKPQNNNNTQAQLTEEFPLLINPP